MMIYAGRADGWKAVLHWSSVCTGISAEVRIKQTILLDEDDDMLDFMNALQISLKHCSIRNAIHLF